MAFGLRMSPSAEPTAIAAITKNATCAIHALRSAGSGTGERGQHLLRIDHPTSTVGRELENTGIHADRVLGARFDAVAAEHALAEIDVEAPGHLLDLGVRVLVGHDVDAVGRTDGLAHHARDAARRAVLAPHQAVQRA